ncbi:YihY/virulence factor BrkB family protein [Kitasatospora sp. NPDC093550]|uniref:YihY/virulence factor BrkB family protein n=1 Tax=Kitasatospora sp. NPDC093550 TaxID=3364089 RepID=UPI003812C857
MQAAGDTSRPNPERPSRRRGKGSRRAAKQATWRRTAWELVKDTTNTCVEYRVTGLAAEAAFFTLLSIPPLLLGLAGTLGYLDEFVGQGTIAGLKKSILSASGTVLSDSSVNEVVVPLLDGVFDRTRPDLVSIGFLLSLWSGSRALYIFIDTITVMYGLDGKRGIVKTRLMSLSLYFGALVIGSLVLPLLMLGPGLLENAVPGVSGLVGVLYWPVAIVLLTVSLTTLYHLAVPVSTPWREDIPGALVALVVLVFCSVGLRVYLVSSVEGPSVYGSLAAPVAVLLWIFVVALAVLIGAAMNAAIDRRWPTLETADARAENERAHEEAAAAVVREVAARRAVERARRARELGLAEGAEEEWGEEDGEDVDVPSEYPERWADVLAADNVRGRLTARGGPHHRPAPPPPDSDRPSGPPPGPPSGPPPGPPSGPSPVPPGLSGPPGGAGPSGGPGYPPRPPRPPWEQR